MLALRPAVSVVSIRVVRVITGELKSKIDRIWDAFWSGGISNPEVILQITHLLFIRRLTTSKPSLRRKANITGKPSRPGFDPTRHTCAGPGSRTPPRGHAPHRRQPRLPMLRSLGDGTTYSASTCAMPASPSPPGLLSKVVDMLDDIPMADRDTNGDLYEYLLSKIAAAGVNGQFRTLPPHHRA